MKIVAGFLSVATLLAVSLASSNYAGYCLSEQRFPQKDELVEIALRDAFRSVFDGQGDLSVDDEKKTAAIAEFIKQHPDCCSVIRTFDEYEAFETSLPEAVSGEGYFYPTFWGRLSGDENYLVAIRYTGKRKNSVVFEDTAPRIVYRMIGTCGQVKRYI